MIRRLLIGLSSLVAAVANAQTREVYLDALGAGWANWSWSGTYTFSNPSPVHAGTASIRCEQQAWGGLSLHHAAIAANAYQWLEFYIHGGATGGQQLWVLLEDDNTGSTSAQVRLESYIVGGDGVAAGAWRQVSIPLYEFALTTPSYTRIDIQNRTGSTATYYVDDIRLTQASSSPPHLTAARFGNGPRVVAFFDMALIAASADDPANYQLQSAAHADYHARRTATAALYDAGRIRVELTFPADLVAGARYTLYVNNVASAAGATIAPDSAKAFAFSDHAIAVDALADNRPISPLIYGVAWAPSTAALIESGATLHRWGGNHTSTYNWIAEARNAGNDWYFQNSAWSDDGDDAVAFANRNAGAGVATLLTVPALPYVAKNTTANSFSVAKYGPQQAVDPFDPDAGNGVGTNGVNIVNDPLDSGVPSRSGPRPGDPTGTIHQDQFLNSVLANADAGSAALPFVAIDNEADIWSSTHRDWHPAATTYDEIWSVFTDYASMVRAVSPQSQICAPVSCCWWYYWNSAAGSADKAAHGGVDLLEWFLDRARQHETQTGQRLLDVFDIHYYPESFSNGGADPAQQLRSTRELWDSAYRSEGWIGTDQWATQTQPRRNYPQLIPRFKALIAAHYPGTRLGLTEYNWGADDTLPGALALADCLGIFGREGLDLACHWTFPPLPGRLAFQLYRNRDGGHAAFGDLSCRVTAGDPDLITAYAATESSTGALTLIVVNKNPDIDYRASLTFSHFIPAPAAQVWQFSGANLKSILTEPDASGDAVVFPAYSATFLRFAAADTDGDTLPDFWEQTYFGSVTGAAPDADPDGDGFTNEQEERAGTIPTDPESALRITGVTRDGAVSFLSALGKRYAVERRDDLTAADGWAAFASDLAGTGGIVTVTDPDIAHHARRFYRVRLLP